MDELCFLFSWLSIKPLLCADVLVAHCFPLPDDVGHAVRERVCLAVRPGGFL